MFQRAKVEGSLLKFPNFKKDLPLLNNVATFTVAGGNQKRYNLSLIRAFLSQFRDNYVYQATYFNPVSGSERLVREHFSSSIISSFRFDLDL